MSTVFAIDDLLDRSNLTGRQLLIYAGQRLRPGAVLYNTVYAIRWPDLDPRRFNLAWQRLVDSCDALRLVFEEVDGVPQQRVVSAAAAEVDCVDVSRNSEPELALNQWMEVRLRRPLSLTERVFDTALIRTAEREYAWFLHIHHIVVDGVAIQILLRRITELYSCVRDETLPRFADHVEAARALRRSEPYRGDQNYWLAALKDVPETPHYYGVDASRTIAQERVVLRLDAPTSTALSALAHSLAKPRMSRHAAIANLFNAVFAAFLSRVGRSEQVSIGVTFHNRSSDIDKRTIGLFMEVFPLILHVRPDDSLVALMQQVASSTTQALKHRQYSVGHSARAPAFSGLFNYIRPLVERSGLLDVRRIHPGEGPNALSLNVEPRGETYELWLDINADVAASSSARRVAEHLRTLLEAAIQDPDRPLADLPLLSTAEMATLVAVCGGPIAERPPDSGGCHAQFEMRASETPDAVAVISGGTQVSYADLNRRANRLACELRACGAKRGKRVGICLERSLEMVVAVLAVMKSGAAYVPLDPAYPPMRLHTMLIDADPVVLVTTERNSKALPPHAALALYIDREGDFSEPEAGDLQCPADSAGIAYVLYTSGTTGTPKGVLVTHGNVSNHLAWRSSYFPVQPSDRCLQTASLSFDDSVWEILEPLSAGACLVLARPRFEFDSAYLVNLMVEEGLTIACFVPSLLRAVIDEPAVRACVSLRRLTTGGEGLSVSLQRRVLEQLPTAAFYNGYGTTEATIASAYWKCVNVPGQSVVPIGRPIANTQIYILDANRQLVPPGVLGEICIGGAGVARGYLNRADLTAERFVHDPHGSIEAATLYRTGDLGRLRSDGVFEFAGRADDQIKIRGVRVELGDIEAALLDHPAIRSAAVVCGETPSGTRLTAYVVPRSPGSLSSGDLRSFVRDRIPSALVPNRFVSISALPMTPSGKLDRRALPAVNADEEQRDHVAARNEIEGRLVSLWEEVLQARPIGIHDDFFELGGHSLSAVQVASKLEKMLGRSLSPGLLFEAPTIERLSSRLSAYASTDAGGVLVPLAPGKPGAPLFLVHHVSGDVTAYRDLARYLGAERSIYGVRAPELDSGAEPLDRVEAMASRYVAAIHAIQPQGPYLIGGHSAGAHIAFEMAQQLRGAGEHVALLAILEADARTRSGRRSLADSVRFQIQAVRSLPAKQRGVYLWRAFKWLTQQLSRTAARSRPTSADETKNAVWTAIERAVRAYRPKPYPGAITLFRATDRRVTGTYGRTSGWGRLAKGGIRIIDVRGTHSTVLRPGSEPPMAAKLRTCLDEIDR